MDIHRRGAGLDDKYMFASDRFGDVRINLAVRELHGLDGAFLDLQMLADFIGELSASGSREYNNIFKVGVRWSFHWLDNFR